MKKLLALLLALVTVTAQAQFSPGTILTAAALNAALAAPTITNGTITGLTAPLSASLGGMGVASPTANAVLVGNGSSAVRAVGPCTNGQMLLGVTGSTPYCGNNPALVGATVDNSVIGGTTPAAASFTGANMFFPNASTQSVLFWENNGSPRWSFYNDGTAESGSNAGSNWGIARYSDAGSYLANALSINRASGNITIPSSVFVSGDSTFTGGIDSSPLGVNTPAAAKVTTLNVSGAGTFGVRPTFNSNTPWDSGNFTPPYTGTSTSIGGSSLSAGACATTTVSISGVTTSMATEITPVTYPGAGFYWRGYVSAAGTVTVTVCAAVAGTPTASTYNVRVLP